MPHSKVVVFKSTGILRNIAALGDRVLQKNIRDKERLVQNTGRYIAFEIDANPMALNFVQTYAQKHIETLNVFVNKMPIYKCIERIYATNALKLSPYYDYYSPTSELEEKIGILKDLNSKEEKITKAKTKQRRESEKKKEVFKQTLGLRRKERDMAAIIYPSEYGVFENKKNLKEINKK